MITNKRIDGIRTVSISANEWNATRQDSHYFLSGHGSCYGSTISCWVRINIWINHTSRNFPPFFSVINSSINMIIYCCLSPRFRKLITPFKRKALRSYFTTGTANTKNETETTKCEDTVNVLELQSMRTARKVYI